MKRNVGKLDQVLRIVLGLVILALGLFYGSWWGAIGFLPMVTGLTGRCPLYSLFGWSTCRTQPAV